MIKVIGTGKNYSNNLIDSILSFNTTSTWSVSSGTGSAVCSTDYAFDGVQSLKLNSTALGSTFIATNSIQSSIIPRDGVYGLVVSIRKDHRLQPITLKVNIYKNAVLEYGSEFTIGNALDSSLDDNDIWVRFMTDVDLSLSATDEITFTFEQKSMTSALTETTVYIDGIHLYSKDNVDTLAPLYVKPEETTSKFGDVDNGNYVEIGEDGTIRLHGDATTYDDLRVPVSATTNGGTKDPDFAVFKTDGSGSQGVFLQWFSATIEEELYFDVQMPHNWKEGSDIEPHIHWTPKTTGATGEFVKWGLEYTWSNVNEVFGDTTIIYSDVTSETTATVSGDTVMTEGKHHITDIGTISATGKTLSSMLVCRIFRDATDTDDDYTYDAGLLEIDFHYEIDSLGSEEEFTKD